MRTKRYKRRSGTKNQGVDYETKIAALLLARCANPKRNVKTFWIGQNVDDPLVGDFDDIVLTTRRDDGDVVAVFCIQLKHFGEAERKKPLRYGTFNKPNTRNTKNPFNLAAYARSVDTSDVGQLFAADEAANITYVLYTNKKRDRDDSRFAATGNQTTDLLNANGCAFRVVEHSQVNRNFMDNLLVYSDQIHEEDVMKSVADELQDFLAIGDASKAEGLAAAFRQFVVAWSDGRCGGHRTLTTDEVRYKLAELCLAPYACATIGQLRGVAAPPETMDKWRRVCAGHRVVVFDVEDVAARCADLVHQEIRLRLRRYTDATDWTIDDTDRRLRNVNRDELRQMWEDDVAERLSLRNLYMYLWKRDEVPLLLRCPNANDAALVSSVVDFYRRRYVLFASGCDAQSLRRFKDLTPSGRKVVLGCDATLQGRRLAVRDLLWCEALKDTFRTGHIALSIIDALRVGGNAPTLPRVFVPRRVRAVHLNPTVFIGKPTVYYVVCDAGVDGFLEYAATCRMRYDPATVRVGGVADDRHIFYVMSRSDYGAVAETMDVRFSRVDVALNRGAVKLLSASRRTVYLIVTKASRSDFETFLTRRSVRFDTTEVYRFADVRGDGCVPLNCRYVLADDEDDAFALGKRMDRYGLTVHLLAMDPITYAIAWLTGWGCCETVRQHRHDLQVENDFVLTDFFKYNRPSLISASPGMGKTVLMAHLASKCPTDTWTITVNLNEHLKYLVATATTTTSATEHLKHFADFVSLNEFDQRFAEEYIVRKRTTLFFDGFDEIAPDHEDKVCDLMRTLSRNGFPTLITTRPVKQSFLEAQLNTIARTIKPFTETDQNDYITATYKAAMPSNDATKIKRYVNGLLRAAGLSRTPWDIDFCGVPLQTVMITDIHLDSCSRYCRSDVEHADFQTGDVLFVYRRFVDLKMDEFQRKTRTENAVASSNFSLFRNYLLDKHQECALKALFPDEDVDVTDFVGEVRSGREKTGIIETVTDDGVPVFVHRTFAEYLVGLYLARNFGRANAKHLLAHVFADDVFDVVRNVFDRLLTVDAPAHRAILDRNADQFLALVGNGGASLMDAASRTPLHLAVSWCARHRLPDDERLNNLNVGDWNTLLSSCDNVYNGCRNNTGTERFVALALKHESGSPEATDSVFGETALQLAQRLSALQAVDILLGDATPPDGLVRPDDAKATLFLCAIYDYANVASATLSIGTVDANERYDVARTTLLHFAALYESNAMIRLLIDNGLNVDVAEVDDQTALHFASRRGRYSTVRLLLAEGADPNRLDYFGQSPLYMSIIARHRPIEGLLREAERRGGGATTRTSDLVLASIDGDSARVDALLIDGADVDEVFYGGNTPLMYASARGLLETVQTLLKNGASVNKGDDNDYTSLMLAAWYGHVETCRLLLSAGADTDKINGRGETALSLAKEYNHNNVVEMLLAPTGANNTTT